MANHEIVTARYFAPVVSTNGSFMVVVGSSVKAFNLTEEKAREWASYYHGAEVVTAAEFKNRTGR